MCCRLMRALQYLDLSHNGALSRAPGEDGSDVGGVSRPTLGLVDPSREGPTDDFATAGDERVVQWQPPTREARWLLGLTRFIVRRV